MQPLQSGPVRRAMTPSTTALIGGSLIALALGFNLPYLRLAQVFDYPGILRQPADRILAAFAAGGPGLVLTWYAFALSAFLFVPVSMAHALGSGRVQRAPGLAVAAAVTGALAGVMQAMGLLRWVMVVPDLARTGDLGGFTLIHAYAGVALGEHLGQLLTAMTVGLVALMQWQERRRLTAALGGATVLAITLGALEGVALAIGAEGTAFGFAAVLGYLLLTLWMVGSGLGLIRRG